MSWVAIGGSVAGAVVSGAMSKSGGGGGEATQQSNQTTNNVSQTLPQSGNVPLYGYLQGNQAGLMQQPQPYFPGQTYVSPSQSTQQSVQSLMGAASGMSPFLGTSQNNYNYLSGAADVANNPYVQAMNARTTSNLNDNLTNNLLPSLQSGAVDVNALGSGRLGLAQGEAISGTQKAIADAQASTNLGAYDRGMNAQQYALGQTGNMLQNQLAPANALSAAGQTVEGYQQAALGDQINRFNWMFNEPYSRMGNVGNTLNTTGVLDTSYGSGAQSGQMYNPYQQSQDQLYNMGVGANMGESLAGKVSNYFSTGTGGTAAPATSVAPTSSYNSFMSGSY